MEHLASLSVESRKGCPPFSKIARSFSSMASRRGRKKLIDHISRCPSCHKEFSFLVQLQRKEQELAETATNWALSQHAASSTIKRNYSLLLDYSSGALTILFTIAATILLLIGLYHPSIRGPSPFRISVYSPSETIYNNSSTIFSWKDIGVSSTYAVEVYDEALRLIWKSEETKKTFLVAPSMLYSSIIRGKKYYWSVAGTLGSYSYYSALKAFSLSS